MLTGLPRMLHGLLLALLPTRLLVQDGMIQSFSRAGTSLPRCPAAPAAPLLRWLESLPASPSCQAPRYRLSDPVNVNNSDCSSAEELSFTRDSPSRGMSLYVAFPCIDRGSLAGQQACELECLACRHASDKDRVAAEATRMLERTATHMPT